MCFLCPQRHPGSWRFWRPGNRRKDSRHQLGQKTEKTFPRYNHHHTVYSASISFPCVIIYEYEQHHQLIGFHVSAGVCLGMQLAVCEFARNTLGWKGNVNSPM